jgi:hypothetical protein
MFTDQFIGLTWVDRNRKPSVRADWQRRTNAGFALLS